MPLLLLLPLLVLAIVALWAVLLPISLIQRYRFGRKRRRVLGWANSVNAWLVLALTLLVAGRILLGLWQLYEHGFQWHPIQREEAWFLRPDSLFALGGLLLGHYAAWCWGLRTMLRRSLPRRGE